MRVEFRIDDHGRPAGQRHRRDDPDQDRPRPEVPGPGARRSAADCAAGAQIPLDHTASPLDVVDAVNGLADTLDQIDTTQLAQAFTVLSQTFADTPADVTPPRPDCPGSPSSIAARDDRAARAAGARARRSPACWPTATRSCRSSSPTATCCSPRSSSARDAIHELLVTSTELATQISGLVADNRAQLAPALSHLRDVLAILQRDRDNLEQTVAAHGAVHRRVHQRARQRPMVRLLPGRPAAALPADGRRSLMRIALAGASRRPRRWSSWPWPRRSPSSCGATGVPTRRARRRTSPARSASTTDPTSACSASRSARSWRSGPRAGPYASRCATTPRYRDPGRRPRGHHPAERGQRPVRAADPGVHRRARCWPTAPTCRPSPHRRTARTRRRLPRARPVQPRARPERRQPHRCPVATSSRPARPTWTATARTSAPPSTACRQHAGHARRRARATCSARSPTCSSSSPRSPEATTRCGSSTSSWPTASEQLAGRARRPGRRAAQPGHRARRHHRLRPRQPGRC